MKLVGLITSGSAATTSTLNPGGNCIFATASAGDNAGPGGTDCPRGISLVPSFLASRAAGLAERQRREERACEAEAGGAGDAGDVGDAGWATVRALNEHCDPRLTGRGDASAAGAFGKPASPWMRDAQVLPADIPVVGLI